MLFFDCRLNSYVCQRKKRNFFVFWLFQEWNPLTPAIVFSSGILPFPVSFAGNLGYFLPPSDSVKKHDCPRRNSIRKVGHLSVSLGPTKVLTIRADPEWKRSIAEKSIARGARGATEAANTSPSDHVADCTRFPQRNQKSTEGKLRDQRKDSTKVVKNDFVAYMIRKKKSEAFLKGDQFLLKFM